MENFALGTGTIWEGKGPIFESLRLLGHQEQKALFVITTTSTLFATSRIIEVEGATPFTALFLPLRTNSE